MPSRAASIDDPPPPGARGNAAGRSVALRRAVLREQIKDVLLQRILDGIYAPGDRIVEIRLAEEFGLSQAPVREALRELEILRLVVSEPFRGVRVKQVRPEEITEIYPVRAALEELAARTAAPGLAGRIQPLADEVDAMRAAAADRDLHRFVSHDVGFHRLFVHASANQTLIEVWESLHVELRTRLTLIRRVEELGQVAETHVCLMEALGAGEAELAGGLVREHIEAFGRWVAERIATPASDQA